MTLSTAQLCDTFAETAYIQIAEPSFKSYGANSCFSGQIATIKVYEDNVLIKSTLSEPVTHRVLVVDGGGSHRCALVGVELAKLAIANGWQGLVIYGCIRDADLINTLPIAIRALHTHPLKSHKTGHGDRDQLVTFAGVNFKKDHYLYADNDGIIVSDTLLR